MNPKGHSKSLVPAQPGNLNAAKTGVFSERLLAPLVAEAEAALATQPPEDTVGEVLRRELAALVVLAQAMDASLERDGIQGRGGEPRSLIDRRLRLNDRLRHTLSQYMDAAQDGTLVADSDEDESEPADETEQLAETIARYHFRDSIKLIRPAELDPEGFLRAVVVTNDPAVTFDDCVRARRLLTRRAQRKAKYCVCSATLMARDELEFRDWISEAQASGTEPNDGDPYVATLVRRVANGERLEPWFRYQLTWYAIEETVQAGVESEGAEETDAEVM